MLEALGFGPVEESVYQLLLLRGRQSREEILASGEREAQRQALEVLEAKGLVRRLAGSDPAYVVAPPEYAIDVLIAEQMNALQEARAKAVELAAQVRRAAQPADPAELIEVVSGEGSARQLFRQVVSSAQQEIAVFDCPPYATATTDFDEVLEAQLERVRADRLRLRTVFERSLLDDPAHVQRIMDGVASGEQARIARVPLKMAVIDRSWGMLPLLHADGLTPEAVVIVRRSVLLDSMLALFESVWDHAVEVRPPTSEGPPRTGVEEEELRQLAQLLAVGMTDIAIAHHLGVSERTVRRRVKDLMDELGVQARFQAGVRAAERGWV